ncbi:MAG: hypothetical protein J5778_03465 [Clostridiales bacterium]|nr:hypothetical protein [Clostridiales bacterium]
MGILKKASCIILCVVYVLGLSGLTGCVNIDTSAKKEMVMETISKIPEYIKTQDYDSLREYMYSDNEKVREIFKLGEGVDDEETVAVRKAIASTMRSNVHEDTLESSNLGQSAKIKVDFMVVDFNKFTENNRYCRDIDSMKEDIAAANSKAVIIYTFPMRFIFRDGKAILENDELLEDLFEFASYDEIVFAGNLTEYLGDYTFVDSTEDTYKDSKEIRLEIDISEKGQHFNWIYDYEVFYTGPLGKEESIFTESCEEGKGLEKLLIRYSTGKELEAGTYRIAVSYKGEQKDYVCKVETTDKNEEKVPSGYKCPEGDSIELSGSNVTVKIPSGYSFLDSKSYLASTILNSSSRNYVEFIVASDDQIYGDEFMYNLSMPAAGIGSDSEILDTLVKSSKELYKQYGAKVSTKKGKTTIGSRDYKSCDLKMAVGTSTSHIRIIVVPGIVNYNLLVIFVQNKDSLKTYTSMLH